MNKKTDTKQDARDRKSVLPYTVIVSAVSGKDEVRVPIHLKMTLTIKEAAEYSNIGMNKIDTMLKQPNCPFVLFVGTRKLVKR